MPFVSVVCCQVEVSALGRSFVESSPTDCGVSEFDRQASTTGRPRPLGAVTPWGRRIMNEGYHFLQFVNCCILRVLAYCTIQT